MILIDPPAVPRWDRLWSHLASDTSYDEAHAFAAAHGIPARGWDRDHYDVPADATTPWWPRVPDRCPRASSSSPCAPRACGARRRCRAD